MKFRRMIMKPPTKRLSSMLRSLSAPSNASIFCAAVIVSSLCCEKISAQTLTMQFGFEDSGVTTVDSVNGVSLDIVNSSGAATDLHGAVGTGVAGVGRALDFTSGSSGGSGPLAWVSSSSALNLGSVGSFTVTMWLKPEQTISGFPRFFALGTTTITDVSSSGALGFSPDTGANGQLFIDGGSKIVLSGFNSRFPGGQWTFLALTYDGNTNVTLYTGSESGSISASQKLVRSVTTPLNVGEAFRLMIGNNSGRSRAFDGWIDDVRFYTGTADSNLVETVRASAIPDPFVGPTMIAPNPVPLGSSVTVSATAGGTQPISYQWIFTDTNGVTSEIPGATADNFSIANAQFSDAGTYHLVVSNSISGPITNLGAVMIVKKPVMITDAGTAAPVPTDDDIFQLTDDTATAPTGLNYYTDNGEPPGQIFTTGSNPNGYSLASLYIKFGSNGGHSAGNPWTLRLYSLSAIDATTATLIGEYQNDNVAPAMDNNWCKWFGNITNVLSPDSIYAYTIRARSANGSSGGGYLQVASAAGDLYSGGQAVDIDEDGSPVDQDAVGYDGTFLLHLVPAGHAGIADVTISPATSETNQIYAGTPVKLNVQAVGDAPLSYTWQTDSGIGNWSDLSGSNTNSYAFDTTGRAAGLYQFRVIVANSVNSATSSVVTLNLMAATAPIVVTDTKITPAVIQIGGSAQMSASFTGPMPITYRWMFDDGGGAVAIPGATNSTFTLSDAQLSDGGNYFLEASNAEGTTPSTPVALSVKVPGQVNTTSAIIVDAGSFAPTPGSDDIFQLTDYFPTAVPGLNYTVDAANPPGQTFTTGNNPPTPEGYPLTSLYIREEFDSASDDAYAAQSYTLNIYSVTDSGVALLTSYVSANTLRITDYNWIRWAGLTNILQPNSTYAFSIRRNQSGSWTLANDANIFDPGNPANDLYSGGEAVTLPSSGFGNLNVSTDPTIDATFLIGLTPVTDLQLIRDTELDPSPNLFVGQRVTMSAYFSGPASIVYQWQFTDTNGVGPVNIPGATNTSYTIAPLQYANAGTYNLVASNAVAGGTVLSSSPVTLTIAPPPTSFIINFANFGYDGAGVIPSGTYWNRMTVGGSDVVNGENVTIKTNITSFADDGVTSLQIGFGTVQTWEFIHGNGISLLDNYMLLQRTTGQFPFVFTGLPAGVYDLVLYGCNGSYGHGRSAFTVNGVTKITINPTDDSAFVEGTNYVVFTNIVVLDGTLEGSWSQPFDNEAAFNGAQLQLRGVVTVNPTPTELTTIRSGNELTLSWPADHVGWRLQVQTNSLDIGLTADWIDVVGSESVHEITVPVNQEGAVFYRLILPQNN